MRKKSEPSDSDKNGYHLTSGDLARMLDVDLKTIHNWVNQGHIVGRRTKGRHLRFDRTEVVRFMREYGYSIPDHVSVSPPRVVVDKSSGKAPGTALKRGVELTACEGLFQTSLAVADGEQEVLVLDLDQRNPKLVVELLESIRSWPATQNLSVIGVSKKPAVRKSFLKSSGDIALAPTAATDLKNIVKWLTGGEVALPPSAELPE